MATSLFTSGLIFPIQIESGKPKIVTGVELIKSSIKTILSWPTFQRMFNHTFGSRVFETLEEPNDDILNSLMNHFIIDALSKWEKRIIMTSVDIQRISPIAIKADIYFRVRELSIDDSVSYTFNF